MLNAIRSAFSRIAIPSAGPAEVEVHFHQGPDGQAAPCFDESCPHPALDA
jgi:hypothetical protein